MSYVRTVGDRRFEIRSGLTHVDLVEIEAIQREVWGPDDIVPAPHLRAVEHSGGQLAAAFEEGRMIGFSYGFLAMPHGRGMEGPGLHSHMVAVRSEGRGLGVGQALKWQQRTWAQGNGLGWISWTFDPLQARNARLNLEHLGAVAFDYLVDFYGAMSGPLGGGQSSDRLLALWLLDSQRVRHLEPRVGGPSYEEAPRATPHDGPTPHALEPRTLEPRTLDEAEQQPWAVRPSDASPDAEPLIAPVPDDATCVRVAVPQDVTHLLAANPDLAQRWRGAVGVTLARLLEDGFAAVGFQGGGYVVKRNLDE